MPLHCHQRLSPVHRAKERQSTCPGGCHQAVCGSEESWGEELVALPILRPSCSPHALDQPPHGVDAQAASSDSAAAPENLLKSY